MSLYLWLQTPRIVSLLSESFNPHVRYGAALAVGISCAGTGLSEAISLLEPLTSDVVDFLRQGALIAVRMSNLRLHMLLSRILRAQRLQSFFRYIHISTPLKLWYSFLVPVYVCVSFKYYFFFFIGFVSLLLINSEFVSPIRSFFTLMIFRWVLHLCITLRPISVFWNLAFFYEGLALKILITLVSL